MPKQKGTPKTGGRKKGTPNKVQHGMKEAAIRLLTMYSAQQEPSKDNEEGYSLMEQDFLALDPKDRIAMSEKFMQYTTPKMQAVAITGDEEKPVTIENVLRKQAEESDIQPT